ncbi:Hypothetical predicted protein, partial [Paramuricea clavata]
MSLSLFRLMGKIFLSMPQCVMLCDRYLGETFSKDLEKNFYKVVAALSPKGPALDANAPPFQSSEELLRCRAEATKRVESFCKELEADGRSSPSLFSPIRIETSNHAPVFSKARPLSGEKSEFVKEKLQELVREKVIEE